MASAVFACGCAPSSPPSTPFDADWTPDIERPAEPEAAAPATRRDPLFEAFERAPDAQSREQAMIALVETGDPAVKPLLDGYMNTADPEEQAVRKKLYRRYAVTSGQYAADQRFARDWPYGTPGFPPAVDRGVVWIEDAAPAPRFTLEVETGATIRLLYERRVVAFDLNSVFGARTKAGVWGAHCGMFQGRTEGDLHIAQYRVGPFWEGPFEYVRPRLMPRFTVLHIVRHTQRGQTIVSGGLGLHGGVAVDLWRHARDHAVYLSATGGIDGWFDHYILPGGSAAFGGRY